MLQEVGHGHVVGDQDMVDFVLIEDFERRDDIHGPEIVGKDSAVLKDVEAGVDKVGLGQEAHHPTDGVGVECPPRRLDLLKRLHREKRTELFSEVFLAGEDEQNDKRGGDYHEGVCGGYRLLVGTEIEPTVNVNGNDWGDDDGGQKCEAHVVQRRVPREEDEREFVDAPFASLERIRR